MIFYIKRKSWFTVFLFILFCHRLAHGTEPPYAESTLGACAYQTTGTTVPNSSGTPTVINPDTGTVVSANFFASGAIDPIDGAEFVNVCVSPPEPNGLVRAEITFDVGLDNDTQIKAYPQFLVGSKFGNIFETSFRYYDNSDLPEHQKWPVTATNLSTNGEPYRFANLEFISTIKKVGLPAFNSNLPEIFIKLDIDEFNVVGSERDVMLESWFYDTSKNAAIIGTNSATGTPIAGTLNNIVGIGHPHYDELDNTLLEMMVHIGPLSPHDVSAATRNPGQHQLTEIYSGKDFDGDGIDDHFDVDSHVNFSNSFDPQPGIYSSGVDANLDGIDDADKLPVTIGHYQYSIWYGESFLSPIVIFSRETSSNLTNDFNPEIPDVNLSTEGEISLDWGEFLRYTMNELEPELKSAGVPWALDPLLSPFPAINSNAGAIGGVEIGVEPQTNNPLDEPYAATINKLSIHVDDRQLGLTDDDALREIAVTELIAGLESYANENGSFHVMSSGYLGSGQGWLHFNTGAYNQSIFSVLSPHLSSAPADPTHHDLSLSSQKDLLIYRCKDRVAVFSQSTSRLPTASDQLWWAENNCTTYPTDILGHQFFKISRSLSDVDTPPSIVIDTPGTVQPGFITIAGTSTDNQEISHNKLYIYNTENSQFWNGNAWSSSWFWFDADGTDSWGYSLNLDAGTYLVFAWAFDTSGNRTRSSSLNLLVKADDTDPPSININPPNTLAPGIVTINGSSSDDVAISHNKLYIYKNDTEQFWNGSEWTSSWSWFDATGTDDWHYTLTLDAGNYLVFAWAFDTSNNSTRASSLALKIESQPPDTTAPSISINTPVMVTTGNVTITGSSTDDQAIAHNKLYIYNTKTEQFWNNSEWTSSWSWFNVNGTENWNYTLTLEAGTYLLFAWAFDTSNNRVRTEALNLIVSN